VGKIVVYDLVSENNLRLSARELKDMVRSVRVMCTQRLHSLGVMCTESVILVSPDREGRIQEVLDYVNNKYNELFEELRRFNVEIERRPLIRVLDTTAEQFDTFRELAERQLIARIDESVERVSQVLESLAEIVDRVQRQRVRSRLMDLRREWVRILEASRQLQLRTADDVEYLLELIEQGLSRLEE